MNVSTAYLSPSEVLDRMNELLRLAEYEPLTDKEKEELHFLKDLYRESAEDYEESYF